MNLTRVLIADDDPEVRDGLDFLVNTEEDFKVIGHAQDGLEVIAKTKVLNPDVILMDIQMPFCDGVEATRRIMAEFPNMKIIVLTIHTNSLAEAISAGASNYLLKDSPPNVLYDAIRN
jgi:DNA-binding NarL/FixJ family response regulator